MRKRFKDAKKQEQYEVARRLGTDPASTFYNSDGSHHRGAGHRCAYWDAREGLPSTYSDPAIMAFPYWRAGADDREEVDGLKRGPTWKEWQASRGLEAARAKLTPGK